VLNSLVLTQMQKHTL